MAKRKLKGSKIVVTENLTKQRSELLTKALTAPNVAATWTTDGRIICLLASGRKSTLNDELAKAGDKAIIIDFFATWCGPCQVIAPAFESLSLKYTNIITLKVDVDEADDVATEYQITTLPTFIVIKNNVVVDKLHIVSKFKLQEMFKKYNGS
ncbi:Thioredoxin-2 [Lamellibrachia satsuma]|nr:Thioredoxin-2 [Lamellibrachia satsuma]